MNSGFTIYIIMVGLPIIFLILMAVFSHSADIAFETAEKTNHTIVDLHYLNGGFGNPAMTDATLENGKHAALMGMYYQVGDKIRCTDDYTCRK